MRGYEGECICSGNQKTTGLCHIDGGDSPKITKTMIGDNDVRRE